MKHYDIIFPNCNSHDILESTIPISGTIGSGEGLYGHYPGLTFCHCLVSETQLIYLDNEHKPYKHPSEMAPGAFIRPASVDPWHTFGARVRDKLVMEITGS